MATSIQIPDQAVPYVTALQKLLSTNQAKVWAASLAYCLASLEFGYVKMAHACLVKLVDEFAAYMDPTVGPIIDAAIAGLANLVFDLQFIFDAIGSGELDTMEAIDGLLELGVDYPGAQNAPAVESFVGQYLQLSQTLGGHHMPVSAVGPIPVVAQPPTCTTSKPQHKGICCAAVTQLGLARAAQGFQYTSCTGKVVCLACGTKASTSVKNPGATVFSVKRVSCGPSGCPALATIQGQIVAPV